MELSWMELASCAEIGYQPFFPDGGGSVATAKSICKGCVVKDECLDAAMRYEAEDTGHRHGVWGGMSPNERRNLARTYERYKPKKKCRSGLHEISGDNLLQTGDAHGRCRACKVSASRESRRRTRAAAKLELGDS